MVLNKTIELVINLRDWILYQLYKYIYVLGYRVLETCKNIYICSRLCVLECVMLDIVILKSESCKMINIY